jgi:excisionase family DNA binding protein
MCDGSDKLLTTPEVQALTGFSRTTVQSLLATGLLPSIKVGYSRRIPTSALNQFIRDRLEEAAAA